MIAETWFRELDKQTAWGFDVWEFSFRSLFHRYGRFFLTRIAFRHPIRTLRALGHYRNKVRPTRTPTQVVVSWDLNPSPHILAAKTTIVGAGFCQKPLEPPCPAARFNHDCCYLEQRELRMIPACRDCALRTIAEQAAQAGAGFYVMTSAEDIARDLLLPALRGQLTGPVLLLVCPYSLGPLSLAMSICGLTGVLLSYDRGDCRDYAAWIKADVGIKPEQTQLPESNTRRMMEWLTQAASVNRLGLSHIAFRRRANIYFTGVST
jgi:hypothetical protein